MNTFPVFQVSSTLTISGLQIEQMANEMVAGNPSGTYEYRERVEAIKPKTWLKLAQAFINARVLMEWKHPVAAPDDNGSHFLDSCNALVPTAQKFSAQAVAERLYVQRRHLEALGIENPVFVISLPKEQMEKAESSLMLYFRVMFGAELVESATRTGSKISSYDIPKNSKWFFPQQNVTVILIEEL